MIHVWNYLATGTAIYLMCIYHLIRLGRFSEAFDMRALILIAVWPGFLFTLIQEQTK